MSSASIQNIKIKTSKQTIYDVFLQILKNKDTPKLEH